MHDALPLLIGRQAPCRGVQITPQRALTALTRRASLLPLFAPRPLCLPRGTNARQVFSAVAIERQYCAAPLEEATGFMGEATRDYAAKYNVRP